MTTQEVKRKLTAILSADVKGYSRLMAEDEEWTVHTPEHIQGCDEGPHPAAPRADCGRSGGQRSGRVRQRGGCGAVCGGDPAGAEGEERLHP